MATTITNQASTNYQFAGSSETLNTSSNINEVVLEDAQGLTLTKSSSVDTFAAGEIITYTIQITNNSSHFFTGVRIIDNLGGGNLAYVLGSARLTVGTLTYPVTPVATNPLTFTLQQLNVGATMTLTYNCQVIFNLPSTVQSITNTVRGIGYTSTGTVTGFACNTIQKKTNGEFSVTKTASQTSVLPNQTFSYFITLSNNSNNEVVSSTTTDVLPSNFVITGVYVRIGGGSNIELTSSEYSLVGTTITIPNGTGNTITVPANGTSVITITGYLI